MRDRVAAAREAALRRRTQLFVPANRSALVPKAALSGADAVILDLEDSVPIVERAGARDALAQLVAGLRTARPGLHVLVRVNSDDSLDDDVQAAVSAGIDGVLVPKVETVAHVRQVGVLVAAAETRHGRERGCVELQLLIESPRGLLATAEIAAAGERTVALMLGVEDLSAELEIDPSSPDFDIGWAHGMIICAARAHGLAAYGLLGSLANYGDLVALTRDARRARGIGYSGSLCIHPRQVPELNRTFSPSEDEVETAREVLNALDQGAVGGTSAVGRGGLMIDVATARRALRLLARAGATDRP